MDIDDEVDEFLEHFGVKGMRWGVRKERSSGDEVKAPLDKKALAKKVAVGAGAIAVAVGAAYLASSVAKNSNTTISSLPKFNDSNFGLQELDSVLVAARGKDKGFQFFRTGGSPTPMAEYDAAGFNLSSEREMFKRYDNKVAARFLDPSGRLDRAGRPIIHEVIVPPSMSNDVSSLTDVVEKVWPMVKDDYEAFYE